MNDPFRSKFTDPDYRRDPKTPVFCSRCQKDIKGTPRFQVHMIDGVMALHPEDEHLLPADYSEDHGNLPIGVDCARIIGMEWVTPYVAKACDEGSK